MHVHEYVHVHDKKQHVSRWDGTANLPIEPCRVDVRHLGKRKGLGVALHSGAKTTCIIHVVELSRVSVLIMCVCVRARVRVCVYVCVCL